MGLSCNQRRVSAFARTCFPRSSVPQVFPLSCASITIIPHLDHSALACVGPPPLFDSADLAETYSDCTTSTKSFFSFPLFAFAAPIHRRLVSRSGPCSLSSLSSVVPATHLAFIAQHPFLPVPCFASAMTAFPLPLAHRPLRHFVPSRRRTTLSLNHSPNSNSNPSPSPPSATPPPSASRSSSASTSSRLTPAPDFRYMSRLTRQILSTFSPPNPHLHHPNSFETALQPHIERHPHNPFLWHSLLTNLRAHYGLDHPPLLPVLHDALAHVPPGSRGILLHFHATLLLHRGDITSAVRLLNDAVITDAYPLLYVALADAHARRRDLRRARDAYRAGVNAFPRHAALWRSWAYFEATHGSREAALHTCREALDRDPTNPRAWRMLLQLQTTFGAGDAHIADVLREALAACPRDPTLRLHLARIEERRKGPRAACATLGPVEHLSHPDVMRTLGRLLFQLGELSRARAYLRRAADLDADMNSRPKSASEDGADDDSDVSGSSRKKKVSRRHKAVKALHAWALMESKVGNVDEARALLAEARSLCQTDAGIWRAIAELESRERNYDEARKAFQNALAIDPHDPRMLLAWGRTEALAGDTAKAEALIARVDALPPNRRKMVKHLAKHVDTDRVTALFDLKEHDVEFNIDEKERASSHNGDDEFSSNNVSLTPHVLAAALRERAILAARDGRFEDSLRLLTRASVVEPGNEVGWRLLASQELRLKGIERLREVYRIALSHVAQRCKYKLLHWWGQEERTNGNVEEARELFRRATLASPDYMSVWMSWGLLEKSVGNVDEACAIFEQAARRAEQDSIRAPFVFQAWGRLEEMERRRPDVAAKIFERGVKLAPACGALWAAWGLLEHHQGDVVKARKLFKQSTDSDPTDASTWHQWALLEAERCNFRSAAQLFERGHRQDAADSSLLTSWASMEGTELGNVALARDLFQRAIDADSQYALALRMLGVMETQAGNVMQARDAFERASRVKNEEAPAWHALGVLEWNTCHNSDAAVRMWRRAIEADATHSPTYERWAELEAEGGNSAGALDVLRDGLEKCAGNSASERASLLVAYARAQRQAGDTATASQLLQKALSAHRKEWKAWNELAELERKKGSRKRALQTLHNGIESCKGSPCGDLFVSAARILLDNADISGARKFLCEGISTRPADTVVWAALVQLEREHGSHDRAERVAELQSKVFSRRVDSEGDALSVGDLVN